MSIFLLETHHGTRLIVNAETRRLHHGAAGSRNTHLVYAWVPPVTPDCCFLIPAETLGGPMLLAGDEEPAAIVSLRLSIHEGRQVALTHALSGNFTCATPQSDGPGELSIDRTDCGLWELFVPVPTSRVPPEVKAEIEMLSGCLALATSGSDALDFLRRQADPAFGAYAMACLRLLLRDQVEWLGHALARDAVAACALAALVPDNIWIAQGLWGLASRHGRSAALQPAPRQGIQGSNDGAPTGSFLTQRIRSIGMQYDMLQQASVLWHYVSVGQMMNAFARRSIAATRGICVVAAARNEGIYLLEWLAYHRALGVETFFIYANDNTDGSDEMLRCLAEAGIIHLLNNRIGDGIDPQSKAYGHALQILPDILDYQWAVILDLDEFVVLDTDEFASLGDFISSIEALGADAIALNWLMYESDGQKHRTDQPVIHRFTTRHPAPNAHVKSICRPHQFIHSRPHYPMWDDYTNWTFRNALGGLHPQTRAGDASAFAPQPIARRAWINHYMFKSPEEYILRRTGGHGHNVALAPSGDRLSPAAAAGFHHHFHRAENIRDDGAMHCVPRLEEHIAALRQLPGVAAASRTVDAAYRNRVATLADILAADPRYQAEGSAEAWFAGIIQERRDALRLEGAQLQ